MIAFGQKGARVGLCGLTPIAAGEDEADTVRKADLEQWLDHPRNLAKDALHCVDVLCLVRRRPDTTIRIEIPGEVFFGLQNRTFHRMSFSKATKGDRLQR